MIAYTCRQCLSPSLLIGENELRHLSPMAPSLANRKENELRHLSSAPPPWKSAKNEAPRSNAPSWLKRLGVGGRYGRPQVGGMF